MANDDDASKQITLTLTNLSGGTTESIVVSPTSTTLEELVGLATAFGLTTSSAADNSSSSGTVTLTVDGRVVYNGSSSEGSKKVGEAGIGDGDMVLVGSAGGGGTRPRPRQQQQGAAGGRSAGTAQTSGGGGGGLDFSALLAGAGAAPAPAAAAAASSSTTATGNTTGLSFNLAGLEAASLAATASSTSTSQPVHWPGMSLDDAMHQNPNPSQFVPLLLSPDHPNLIKELNYHNPNLASKIKAAGAGEAGIRLWREDMMMGGIQGAYQRTMTRRKEDEMSARLRSNPNDVEAKKYFADKTRKRDVDAQYRQMMEEYPEAMGRVLMLYIDAEVNGHPLQAFVDSGAQNTIMSSACAERCELLHLLDTRFEGTAVGVGTGKILGRIHITPLKIGGHYFPCSITVMDSEKGLGDKNMDFLFGLDMLKRHRCSIDLLRNALVFQLPEGRTLEAPFLHEKDLDENKGGTKGFDANRANAELARRMEKAEKDEGKDAKTGEGEAMDVDEDTKADGDGGVAKKKKGGD